MKLSKKSKGIPTKLELFAKWNKRPFADKMLDDGVSPNKVAEWINENGFEISVPTVYSYAKKRKEAIVRGIELEKAFGRKGIVIEVKAEKRGRKPEKKSTEKTRKDVSRRKSESRSVDKDYRIKTDIELIDEVIQRGFEDLVNAEHVDVKTALKAVELKNKLYGEETKGLTVYGLEEIRLREAARENAILTILLEYIPDEKRDEVLTRLETATAEYYDSLGLGDAYKTANSLPETEEEKEDRKKA